MLVELGIDGGIEFQDGGIGQVQLCQGVLQFPLFPETLGRLAQFQGMFDILLGGGRPLGGG